MCGVRLAHPEVRYFLEAVLHFPMASYCENAIVRALCQHCFSLPSLLQPAHWRWIRTIPAGAAPFTQHCFWFEIFHYCPTPCGLLEKQDVHWQHHICPKLLFQLLFLIAAFSIAGFFSTFLIMKQGYGPCVLLLMVLFQSLTHSQNNSWKILFRSLSPVTAGAFSKTLV